jgi:hypothetical protein
MTPGQKHRRSSAASSGPDVWPRVAVVTLAAVAALVPLPPRLVERVYSSGLYPVWQAFVTRVSNLTPVALLDVLLIALAASWIGAAVYDIRRRSWPRAGARMLARTIVWSAGFYILFLAGWGLNYRRVPLADTLQFDAGAVSPAGARDLALAAVDRINGLHAEAHGAPPSAAAVDPSLSAAFTRTLGDLGRSTAIAPARPKSTMLGLYFRRAGVEGMTDPYFLETLVAGELLPFERPFVIAHEWSHLAGIADEGEANFVGWLTCLRAAPAQQYSGWLFLHTELAGALGRGDRSIVAARLAAGPRDDLVAIGRRREQYLNRRVADVGWQVYDRYLKANRVERGAESYADVVRLVLGVRFSASGVPLRKISE